MAVKHNDTIEILEVFKLILTSFGDQEIESDQKNDRILLNWLQTCIRGRSCPIMDYGATLSNNDNSKIGNEDILELRNNLLSHKWQEAMKVLKTLSVPKFESHHMILKVVLELGYRLNCGLGPVDRFIECTNKMKLGNEDNCISVFLFKLGSMLSSGINKANGASAVFDAISNITSTTKKGGKRKAHISLQLHSDLRQEFLYPGLIAYVKWLVIRLDIGTIENDYRDGPQSELKKLSEVAMNCFRECERHSGIWDCVVSKHVDILEFHAKFDRAPENLREAEQILKDYEASSENNPNALILLYQFYRRNSDTMSRNLATNVLVRICKVLPSSIHALELVMSDEDEKDGGFNRIEQLFDLLDDSIWKNVELPWSRLAGQLVEGLSDDRTKDNVLETLKNCWECRKDWWPNFHFLEWTGFASVELEMSKACVAVLLLGKGCRYYRNIVKAGRKMSLSSERFELLKRAKTIKDLLDDDGLL